MLLTSQDRHLVDHQLEPIRGWLLPEAGHMTCMLLNLHQHEGVKGPLFEIGVFEGKYLAVLYHAARAASQRLVGIDTFEFSSAETVKSNLQGLFGELSLLELHKMNSKKLDPEAALALLGGERPRFISVDGDHNAPGVLNDLKLCSAILHERGVIAVDDFLSARAIGVGEGTYRFFLEEGSGSFFPFAYVGNKLFVCRAAAYDFYHDACLGLADEHPDLPMSKSYLELRENGMHWVDQALLGKTTVVF
jgi:methyltransferase family protein